MTKEALAEILDGRQYREEMTKEEEKLAKESDLVICFGASDDLTEFRGSLCDEKGNFKGGKVYFQDGKIANPDHVSEDDLNWAIEKLPFIKAIWCPKKDGKVYASWVFETEIPHSNFDIFEDGGLYCRGIVFDFDFIKKGN